MIKHYCDKCGKEIQGSFLEVDLHKEIRTLGDNIDDKWILCLECEMKLIDNFLNPMIKNIHEQRI